MRAGEVVPADGVVVGREAVLDESALTGEALPVTVARVRARPLRHGQRRQRVRPSRRLRRRPTAPTRPSSAWSRPPRPTGPSFTRLADRYAAYFLPFSLAVAGLAWVASGDSTRGLAVMVVATPCPLILAAPIAFVAGLSRAARAGIIVKGAGALERLGGARTVLLDKTGTLTLGQPELERIVPLGDLAGDEALRLAASLDQMSAHVLAESLVVGAAGRGLELSLPDRRREEIRAAASPASVEGHRVAVGSSGWLEANGYPGAATERAAHDTADEAGRAKVLVGVDGELAAVIVMGDRLRPGADTLARDLRDAGIAHVALVTGDRAEIADERGPRRRDRRTSTPTRRRRASSTSSGRSATRPARGTSSWSATGSTTHRPSRSPMSGLRWPGKGATISSETADVVITVDDASRIALSILIGRRSLHIARQSVIYGLGLSVAAMVVAAFGYLPPVWGALLQEAIDVSVILNALRALRG